MQLQWSREVSTRVKFPVKAIRMNTHQDWETLWLSTSACARKLPLYTRLNPMASPWSSSVCGRFKITNGLCSWEEAPRVLPMEVMPGTSSRYVDNALCPMHRRTASTDNWNQEDPEKGSWRGQVIRLHPQNVHCGR